MREAERAPQDEGEALERRLEELAWTQAHRLADGHAGVTGCRVVLELRGPDVRVRLRVSHWSQEIEIDGDFQPAGDEALRQAFELAGARVVADAGSRRDQEPRAGRQVGRVSRLQPLEGCGFLRTHDGRDVFFESDAINGGDFRALAIGSRLSFREVQGEEGPEARSALHLGRPENVLP